MRNDRPLPNPHIHRILSIAGAAAIAAASTAAPVRADDVRPPRAPVNLRVPAGNRAFLEGHAVGTQAYSCLPAGTGVAWTFFGPQATLFTDHSRQVMTHFLSPNPFEAATPRATWQHSRDSSAVWGMAIQTSSDPRFVKTGAIPWLLLQVVGAQDGPTNGDTLTPTTFIQRLNTVGGIAPATGCTTATDIGKRMLVPYEADYYFYKYSRGRWDREDGGDDEPGVD